MASGSALEPWRASCPSSPASAGPSGRSSLPALRAASARWPPTPVSSSSTLASASPRSSSSGSAQCSRPRARTRRALLAEGSPPPDRQHRRSSPAQGRAEATASDPPRPRGARGSYPQLPGVRCTDPAGASSRAGAFSFQQTYSTPGCNPPWTACARASELFPDADRAYRSQKPRPWGLAGKVRP
eukprot:scaffold213_cov245-Pinguiococcus_pyrenoidosus.AAC.6